jgi:primosomal protein N' (replication factor Y)
LNEGAVLKVALDTPLRRLFDYLPPPGHSGDIAPGCRVRVPFGRQRLVGLVVGTSPGSELPPDKLRPALAVLDTVPLLDPLLLAFIERAATYYHHPLGSALAAALPKLLREGASREALEERWSVTDAGMAALAAGELRRAPRRQALVEQLVDGPRSAAQLEAACGATWREAARALLKSGHVRRDEQAVTADAPPAAGGPGDAGVGPPLGAEQAAAVAQIGAQLGRYGCVLLEGITGSGKTEVYLQAIAQVLARGEAALMLCPEIGLTPQLVERVAGRFTAPTVVLHSALTDLERLQAWRRAASGAAGIVIGTRSAVFAPVPRLGLLIVDEEHDSSFKQQEGGFRYSARDLAMLRASLQRVPVVLGSATPSLETLQNVVTGRASRASLPRRAGGAEPPQLRLVDLRAHPPRHGLSAPLAGAIDRHLGEDGQVLLYLNRRGYAPTLLCVGCGWIAGCTHCDARLTVHHDGRRLACHHCGAESELPPACPRCGHDVKPVGQGTERVEEALRERCPAVTLERFDRDVLRAPTKLHAALDRATRGEARILIGTQMLTKGHHFPGVTLVGVLNADQSLFSTDFRAAERLAQTIVQVAGRAGREQRRGEVLIQSEYPDHPLLTTLLESGYAGFAAAALVERQAAGWPPFARLALLRASGTAATEALEFLRAARAAAPAVPGVRLLGPVPAAMLRRAGRFHAQLLAESAGRPQLHRFLDAWLVCIEALAPPRSLRWSLDVDPLEVF